MSHYQPYPAYKDSGVEWIGPVPEHWSLGRLRDFVQTISTGPFGTALGSNDYVSDGVPVINPSHIAERGCVPDPAVTIDHAKASQLAFWAMKPGDVVTARRGELGRAAIISDQEAGWICGTGSIRIVPDASKITSEYVHTTLQADYARRWLELQSVGSTMPNLSERLIGDLPVAVPPTVHEQQSLLRHSIEETTRIDALITKKTRFIELLKEKRHALIDHAVTKGLNPDATMRDSEVDWLGEIPAHWLVAQLGKISIERCDGPFGSGLKSEHYKPDGVRVVRLQNIGWASFKDGNEAFISHQHWEDVLGCGHEVLPNDVLIGGLGDDKNPLGRACVAPSNLGPAMVKADCYRFRLNTNRANPDFIALALSATARAECGYLATGATRDRLNLGLASARVVPLPPLNEQTEIVASLNRDTARIDLLTEKTQRSIDLLKERRAAFIAAAVTGQIDLRESA